jgi:hypothetical protein
VDVHKHLKLANEGRKPVLSKKIVHPVAERKNANAVPTEKKFVGLGQDGEARMLGENYLRLCLFPAMIGDYENGV